MGRWHGQGRCLHKNLKDHALTRPLVFQEFFGSSLFFSQLLIMYIFLLKT